MNLVLNKTNSSTSIKYDQVKLSQFECPDYVDDLMKSTIGFLTPVLVSLAFLTTFIVGISNIITEKEAKMKVIYFVSLSILLCLSYLILINY